MRQRVIRGLAVESVGAVYGDLPHPDAGADVELPKAHEGRIDRSRLPPGGSGSGDAQRTSSLEQGASCTTQSMPPLRALRLRN